VVPGRDPFAACRSQNGPGECGSCRAGVWVT